VREAESSGGTFFDGMSHEQMLAWLDQANAGVVSGAAERLKSAADEIEKIAGELKVRPQWVAWKGEGADAFRTWAADLAGATLRLSDFSRGSGEWLGHASDSIALAQSAIPRDLPGATANLAAARGAHNDPDAAGVASKASAELAALKADREEVRLAAASEMTKLAQSYAWSAAQMNALERPKLPPPPKAVMPDTAEQVYARNTDRLNVGESPGTSSSAGSGRGSGTGAPAGVSPTGHASNASVVQPHVPDETLPPVRTGIDSVGTLPPQTPVETPRAPVDPGPVRGAAPQAGPVPPLFGGGRALPVNSAAPQGRTPGAGRVPLPPGSQGPGTVFGRAPGVAGGGNGIIGGRPVLPSEGQPAGAIPRGTVVGGEGTPVRGPMGPMGQTTGMANPVGRATGTSGSTPGGRPVSPSGGIVGGRPAPNSGVVGGNSAQRPGSTGARVPGTNGTEPRTPVTGGTTAATRTGEGRVGAATPNLSQSTAPRSARNGSGRPYGVTEDEETWRRNQRPTVPPVVD